ncbi:MAG TPA: competence/damage-inducible protein A [Gemmatimonadales bacterium]|nr:competence/damage-inducible protein A [Gemmatimonadales bacterium]
MNIELVTIGTELLLGFTVDTNGAEIGRMLANVGVRVARRTAIADRKDDIRSAVSEALGRTRAVIVTGGLGPTRDDITKHTIAQLYGVPIDFDEGLWAGLVERYRRAGRVPVESNRTQAEVPRGATVLPNRWGSASGLWLEDRAHGLVVMLPGVPLEMRNLMEHEVVPRLRRRASGTVIRSRSLRTSGVAEAALAEQLGDVERDIAPVTLAYLPQAAGVDLRLTAWDVPAGEADALLAGAVQRVTRDVGSAVYGSDQDDLAAVVLEAARRRGITIALAESCTGGLVGARLTEIPGSSDVLQGGVVCYSYASKTDLLGVPADLVVEQGAVSEPVVRGMAEGALQRFNATLSVGVTGIAGPGGGTPEKPVGTVWFATAMDGDVRASRTIFFGTRAEVRERAAQTALRLLLARMRDRSAD